MPRLENFSICGPLGGIPTYGVHSPEESQNLRERNLMYFQYRIIRLEFSPVHFNESSGTRIDGAEFPFLFAQKVRFIPRDDVKT
jgi:hypothetical protein